MKLSTRTGRPVRHLLGAALVSMAATAQVLADDRRMQPTETEDDSRISEGQLRHGDLLGAGDRGDDAEEQVQAYLEAARRYVDVQAYDAAMAEIEKADRLVPFHEDVMHLLELVGDLRDGAREAGMTLDRAEEQRRARQAREAMEREVAERQKLAAEEVIGRQGLPRDVRRALSALLDRRDAMEDRRLEARRARERCIGAAARVHAHGAGRQCGDEEEALGELRRRERELDADLAVLSSAVRERHGQDALDRILDRNGD